MANSSKKLTVQYSLQNNSLTHQCPCITYVLLFVLLLIYDEIQIALARKYGIISEGNFIYTKFSKPLELISFLFGDENPIINNLLDVKKLSVFFNVCYNRVLYFLKGDLGFLDF